MQEQLFNPDIYGPGKHPRSTKSRTTLTERSSAVEVHQEPWCQLRHLSGLHPYFHLIGAQGDVGNCLALCGVRGTKVHNDGVTHMVRCPLCAVAQDILRP
jgi:hypothetical protein